MSFLPKLSLESTPCLLRTFITLGGEGVAKKKQKKKELRNIAKTKTQEGLNWHLQGK